MDTRTDETVVPSEIPDGMKWCGTCNDGAGEMKLITDFYFARSEDKNDPQRRRMHWCKECHKRYSRLHRRSLLVAKGQSYRDAENNRVRTRMSKQDAADARRAAERAKQAAVRALRASHRDEYQRLLKAARINEGLSA